MKLSEASWKRRTLKAAREVRKLRELTHYLLAGQVCYFCRLPLSPTAEAWSDYGNGWGPELIDPLTIHHVDGDHANNARPNTVLCHRPCHKSHHMQERHAARRCTDGIHAA